MRKRSSLVVCLVGVFGIGTLINAFNCYEREREKEGGKWSPYSSESSVKNCCFNWSDHPVNSSWFAGETPVMG